ncbi:hypothetical protein MTR67_047875 [Solanum verrucosum]|uniref:Uncharacterized protein n=1 Tax=Solanum verrucosum TaxID=315347 RepID=A0AAF0UXA1_SOLVR|nr:hypothetical protein MTR67_047875 [Solanum verrucosum]
MSQLEPKRINEAMEGRLESKKKVPKKPRPNASGSLSPEDMYGGVVGAFVIGLDDVQGVVGAFVIALDDVQEKKFQSASDHVESANDFAMNCEEAFASRNVQDDGISKGDNLVMYFSLSAGVVINVLNGETTMYTTF